MLEVDPRRRVFFALWPSEPARLATGQIQHQLRPHARPVSPEGLHLTLFYLGGRAPAAIAQLTQIAATIPVAPFAIEFDQLGHWPRPQVIWLGASHAPLPLLNLYNALGTALRKAGFIADIAAFSPHVTLFRKAKQPAVFPGPVCVTWQLNGFYLIESKTLPTGAVYEPLAGWTN